MAYKLTVKSVKGDKVELEVESLEMKVGELKQLLEQKTGIPASEQRLIFAGHVLKDENTLVSHNIKDSGVTINMVRAAPQRRPEPEPEPEAVRRLGGPLGSLGRDPQALRLFTQLLQNPEMMQQAMREIPELSRPEVQETLRALQQNPQMLQQLAQYLEEEQGPTLHTFTADELNAALQTSMRALDITPGPPAQPITAEDFSTAFAAAMDNLMRQAGRGGRAAAAAGARRTGEAQGQRRQRPAHQFITKEFLQQCLENVMRNLRN